MEFITRYWKVGAIAILIASIWYGGYHIRALGDRAAQADVLEAQIAKKDEVIKAQNGVAAEYEAFKAKMKQQRRKANAQDDSCKLSDDALSVLHDNPSGLHPTTSEPDPKVP